jgi:hypothetical protein
MRSRSITTALAPVARDSAASACATVLLPLAIGPLMINTLGALDLLAADTPTTLAQRRHMLVRVPQPPPPITCVKTWLADWDLPAPLRVRRIAGGFTSHVWRLEANESTWVAKLAYQPARDVENGLRAASIVTRTGLNTAEPLLTRNGELTRLVQYPSRQFHALAVLRFGEGQPLDWGGVGSLAIVGKTLGTIHRALLDEGSLELPDHLFSYLVKDDAWGHHPELQPLITRAIDAIRSFEVRQPVTYGHIYGDGL